MRQAVAPKHNTTNKARMKTHTTLRAALLSALGATALLTWQARAEGLNLRLDSAGIEVAALPDHPDASSAARARLSISAKGESGAWSYALGARVDASAQSGTQRFDRARLDYTENYLRWQNESVQVTAGTQNVLWGGWTRSPPLTA